jgi:hypothetical protein
MSQKTIFRKKESAGHLEKFGLVKCTCCSKLVPGKIIYWPGMAPEKKPLWQPCKECGVWLSHLEEDNESLKGRCADCGMERCDE